LLILVIFNHPWKLHRVFWILMIFRYDFISLHYLISFLNPSFLKHHACFSCPIVTTKYWTFLIVIWIWRAPCYWKMFIVIWKNLHLCTPFLGCKGLCPSTVLFLINSQVAWSRGKLWPRQRCSTTPTFIV